MQMETLTLSFQSKFVHKPDDGNSYQVYDFSIISY